MFSKILSEYNLCNGSIERTSLVRNLEAYFDHTMTMKDHQNHLVCTCFDQLQRIKSIHRSLPTQTAIRFINNFVVSLVDYCILSGVPRYQLDRIQSLINFAARLIYYYVIMISFFRSFEGEIKLAACASENYILVLPSVI